MDAEYLENYHAKEDEEYERLVVKKIEENTFNFFSDKYPPDNRFSNLKRPVTDSTIIGCNAEDRWDQVPFSGSTILNLEACPKSIFEEFYFKVSEIPEIINFIKETGKIQIVLQQSAKVYEGLSYLDPFFQELKPPELKGIYLKTIGTEKQWQKTSNLFYTIANISFLDFYFKIANSIALSKGSYSFSMLKEKYEQFSNHYAFLKIRYPSIAEELENSLIDNHYKALEGHQA